MLTPELFDAYRWHRYHTCGSRYPREPGPNPAREALAAARADVAAGKARYPAPIKPYPAVSWQERKPLSSKRLAYVSNTESAGLRFVDCVETEFRAFDDWRDRRGTTGWLTDPYGDTFKDGTGLCWGEVYQLPGRDGHARFVAGYRFGGTDAGPTVDFGTIYKSDTDSDYYPSNRNTGDGTREAARAADELARVAAEAEREYQTAWQAGARYADLGEKIAAARREALEDLATRRVIAANMARVGVPEDSREWSRACSMVRDRVAGALRTIATARKERAELADGHADRLGFYTGDPNLRDAFNEGAGERVLA